MVETDGRMSMRRRFSHAGAQRIRQAASGRLASRVRADVVETAMGLEEWEAEGGASAGVQHAPEDDAEALSAVEPVLLRLLGAALVSEWNNLPMPLQRAVYGRAVAGDSTHDPLTLKRQMARFLHDHKNR